jgi:hypothetical protein
MKPDLETTSVPAWAAAACQPEADLSGRAWTIVGFGGAAQPITSSWRAQILELHPRAVVVVHMVDGDDDQGAAQAVDTDLAGALVGWRLMIAGPADACLRLRAHVPRSGDF